MELWIRSQNKDRIVKLNAVMVTSCQELVAIHCYIDKDTSIWLGNYKSKERALEVLDEIQEYIVNLDKAVIYSQTTIEDYSNVYEMPKE